MRFKGGPKHAGRADGSTHAVRCRGERMKSILATVADSGYRAARIACVRGRGGDKLGGRTGADGIADGIGDVAASSALEEAVGTHATRTTLGVHGRLTCTLLPLARLAARAVETEGVAGGRTRGGSEGKAEIAGGA